MSAREIIARALVDWSGSGQGADDMLAEIANGQADAILAALTAGGYRILAPGVPAGWNAHQEFSESAAFARETFAFVEPNHAELRTTMSKHRARNRVHLREVYVEARKRHPKFADTLLWLLWWNIIDMDRLASLTESATPMPAALRSLPVENGGGG